MGTPQYTLNSSKLWQSQGTEGVNTKTSILQMFTDIADILPVMVLKEN